MTSPKSHGTLAAITLAVTAASLTACAGRFNDRPVLAARVEIPAVAPDQPMPEDDPVAAWTGPGPANTLLARADWPRHEILVPVDGTTHAPVLTRPPRAVRDDSIDRRKNLYPSPESALDLGGQTDLIAREGVYAVPGALIDAVLIPFRSIVAPPWAETQSPRIVYKRYRPDPWYLGDVADEPADTQ